MKPEIMTVGGTYFNFLTPEDSVFSIEDLAHALSNINRYTGHTLKPYNVAQHCVLGSFRIDPAFAYEFLMHDTAEGLIGDVSTPLKNLMPEYKVIEKRVELDLARRFGLSYPMLPQVREVDLRMLATEVRDLMPPAARDWECLRGVEPYADTIEPWTPAKSRKMFLKRFYQLKGK